MNYMLYSVNDIDKARALIFINSTDDICSFQLMFPWVTNIYLYAYHEWIKLQSFNFIVIYRFRQA